MDASSNNQFIDDITLQYFSNKQQYNKIVKTNSIKFKERQEFLENLEKYKNEISSITNEYCNNINKEISNELDEAFEKYAKYCIKHIELKAMEERNNSDDDDDMLFGKIDNPSTGSVHSFWGPSVKKI
tara:strand:- start:902 stop:1285 length:384 start_codon:yes stop_codon:yes gene_type:complete